MIGALALLNLALAVAFLATTILFVVACYFALLAAALRRAAELLLQHLPRRPAAAATGPRGH